MFANLIELLIIFLAGRWDFDTQEEYSDYMSTKEALPKAAFQYGVKMQDGRKTRKNKTEKNEKAELDREWQKIQVWELSNTADDLIQYSYTYKDVNENSMCYLFGLFAEYYT